MCDEAQPQPTAEPAREKVGSQLPQLPDDMSGSLIGWHKATRVAYESMLDALRAPLTSDDEFPGAPTRKMQRAVAAIIYIAVIAIGYVARLPEQRG
jgi:hypothetical protein